jgi:hypothetical protein
MGPVLENSHWQGWTTMKPRYERRGGGDFEFLYGVAFPTAGRNAREKRGEAGTTRRLIGMQGSLQLGTLPTAAEDTEKNSTSPLLAGLLGTTSAWISIGSQAWLWSRFSGLSVCLAHILRCAVVQYCLNVVSDEVNSLGWRPNFAPKVRPQKMAPQVWQVLTWKMS